jgi:hypothetical protein
MRQRARTDLCGGRSAMAVPTATLPKPINRSRRGQCFRSPRPHPCSRQWSAICTRYRHSSALPPVSDDARKPQVDRGRGPRGNGAEVSDSAFSNCRCRSTASRVFVVTHYVYGENHGCDEEARVRDAPSRGMRGEDRAADSTAERDGACTRRAHAGALHAISVPEHQRAPSLQETNRHVGVTKRGFCVAAPQPAEKA